MQHRDEIIIKKIPGKLYFKLGFKETGRIHSIQNGLDEIELALA